MPRSFLVKKCKRVSPFEFSKKAHQQVVNEENNETDCVQGLIQRSQSAFVSFSNNYERKDLDEKTFKEKTSLLIPSSLPLTSAERLRFNTLVPRTPQIEPVAVIYKEPSQQPSPDGEKENFQSNQDDGLCSASPVKGPLSQSTFLCQLCKKVFEAAFSLAQHKCSGIKHIEHRCPECDKVFSCPANLASHRRWHRPRSPGSNRPQKIQKRAASRESSSSSPTENGIREKTSSPNGRSSVESEMKIKDEESNEEAGSPLDPNNNEVVDDKSTQATQNGKYICEQCGKSFKRLAYLRKHMNYHSNSRPYPCQYCGKIFRSLTNRAKHVLEHAVSTKAFSCNSCGSGFSSKSGLEKHIRVHNGEVFNDNPASFYDMPSLQRHIANAH